MELEKVEKTEASLVIKGKNRKIKYGFSAWAQLEKKYGGIKNLNLLEEDIQSHPFETIPFLLWIGLQYKEGLKEENFLDEYGMEDMQSISEVLFKALYGALPKDAEEKKAEGSQ
jgi:hypothetical protein